MFEITKGILPSAKKVVLYGPEGIGKSTFASRFPQPLFVDTEGSTTNLDVNRLPKPTSWEMLCQEVEYILQNPALCRTLVIDTIDWAETLCIASLCAKHGVNGIEGFGWGKGYTYLKEEMGRLLNRLSALKDAGVNVLLTAHAQIRKFEQPDELGAYDRWELKLGKQTCPIVKEWADLLLFANYKTVTVAVDKEGNKHKAQGGRRVMYTSHHPCWDAKNRFGLPEECPFDYSVIAPIVEQVAPFPETPASKATLSQANAAHELGASSRRAESTVSQPPVAPTPDPVPEQQKQPAAPPTPAPVPAKSATPAPLSALLDLIQGSGVTEAEVETVVDRKKCLPAGTKITGYPEEFVKLLVTQWPGILAEIQRDRQALDLSEYEELTPEEVKDLPF